MKTWWVLCWLSSLRDPWLQLTGNDNYRYLHVSNRSELYLHKNKLNISAVKVSLWIIQHVYYLATLYLFHVRSNSSASYQRYVKIYVLAPLYHISQLNNLWYCILNSYIYIYNTCTSKLLNNTSTHILSCHNYVYQTMWYYIVRCHIPKKKKLSQKKGRRSQDIEHTTSGLPSNHVM